METNKFVINDGDLILGHVEFHKELIKGRDKNKTIGGGRWYVDTNIIYFYGRSVDFGRVTKEEFDAAFKQPSIECNKIIFSTKEYFSDVLKELNNK